MMMMIVVDDDDSVLTDHNLGFTVVVSAIDMAVGYGTTSTEL